MRLAATMLIASLSLTIPATALAQSESKLIVERPPFSVTIFVNSQELGSVSAESKRFTFASVPGPDVFEIRSNKFKTAFVTVLDAAPGSEHKITDIHYPEKTTRREVLALAVTSVAGNEPLSEVLAIQSKYRSQYDQTFTLWKVVLAYNTYNQSELQRMGRFTWNRVKKELKIARVNIAAWDYDKELYKAKTDPELLEAIGEVQRAARALFIAREGVENGWDTIAVTTAFSTQDQGESLLEIPGALGKLRSAGDAYILAYLKLMTGMSRMNAKLKVMTFRYGEDFQPMTLAYTDNALVGFSKEMKQWIFSNE